MHFGKELAHAKLHELSNEDRQEEIRDIVDAVAAKTIFDDYLSSQKAPFLHTLTDIERLRALLRLIPSSVLTADSLRSVNIEFAARVGLSLEQSHPFCELFNLGLLGRVQQNSASGGNFQYFRKPYEFDWNQAEILAKDAVYLLHPGLTSYICKERLIYLNRANVIGMDRKWNLKGGHDGVPKIFISHSSVDKDTLVDLLHKLRHKLNLRFPADFWFDKWKIRIGEDIHQKVEKGVSGSDIVVLFSSKTSMDSGWVQKEWRTKHYQEISSGGIRVIVAIIDSSSPNDLPDFLKSKLAIVLSGSDLDYSIDRLAESIAFHSEENISRLLLAAM